MLNSSKSLLSLDFGAGTLKAAEFEVTESGSLCLKRFGIKSLGLEGSQDAAREAVLQRAIQELAAQRGFSAKRANVSAPGFHVFSKFVKLPPVDTSKVTQIIQYEAQQNVPFPLEEVVWDYQITGNTPTGELEVLLVAIKADLVEGMFRTADAAGLRLQLVDVSPAALCNAFRYNYADLDGCTMLLDIGAKTSNVLFFEKNKFSSRSINIGANSITQDFATEARMKFPEAEQFKISEGFVSLGGAYEEPENPKQAQISKIARNVMTRLHIQVNQTIQFYRGQQGGGAPQRLFLAGGASIMPYTAQFFSEKLNIPVEYFNPLRNVQIDPSVNLEELARVAHSFGEVVGLGLRNVAQCPIELNLMPKTIRKRQQFNQKKPYFVATLLSIVLGLVAMGWFYDSKVVAAKRAAADDLQARSAPLQDVAQRSLDPALQKIQTLTDQTSQVTQWMQDRLYWVTILEELRSALIEAETVAQSSPSLKRANARAGLWVERLIPDIPGVEIVETTSDEEAPASRSAAYRGMSPELLKRYGIVPDAAPEPTPGAAPASTNEIVTLKLTCSAVNLSQVDPAANKALALTFADILKNRTNVFSPETSLAQNFTPPEENALTFKFELNLKLVRPIKI